MSNYEVTELTWDNGQLTMHELGGIFSHPTPAAFSFPENPTWGSTDGDTLESIVDQATYNYSYSNHTRKSIPLTSTHQPPVENMSSVVASNNNGGKWAPNSGPMKPTPPPSGTTKKRTREINNNDHESACGSKNETTMMTWATNESPGSGTRTKTITTDDDSAYHCGSMVQENQEEGRDAVSETGRSYTTRKGRAAVVHNQSERRRRDRINQKMKALQKLVPNASKTDKASMLDEVIDYLKQLQAQVQMMNSARLMPQIMMQQQIQMSLMARMGMGMGMGIGMLDTTRVGSASSSFVPSAGFVVPSRDQGANSNSTCGSNLPDSYTHTLMAQSMNIDMYNNRMAVLQQTAAQPANIQMQFNQHAQGGF